MEETKAKFATAEAKLKAQGFEVFNPFKRVEEINALRKRLGMHQLRDENECDRAKIMRICVANLVDCDHIALLPDWEDSEGARFEKHIADKLLMPCLNL